MAVKFPLKMSDGTAAGTMDELREHFDLEAVLGYYSNGRLIKWLEDRYYDEEARQIGTLDAASGEFKKKLCEILGVPYSEKTDKGLEIGDIVKENERRELLKRYTTDDRILAAVDRTAFTQSELDELLKQSDALRADNEGNKVIYLCGEHFIIPSDIEGIVYKGVNNPMAEFAGKIVASDIDLQDLKFDISDYIKDSTWGELHDAFEKNLALGVKLLRQEAEKGNADAQFVFGLWCAGDDDIADITADEEPMGWWQEAADQGHIDANVFMYHIMLGAGLEASMKEGVRWFQKAVEQNSQYVDIAYGCLGKCYMYGIGVEQDFLKAVKCLKKAVEQDDAEAELQYNLGYCYYFGEGVNQDYKEAVKWFREAAEQGDAKAQWRLGTCYEEGDGVGKDDKIAFKWYLKAAEQGNVDAQLQLGKCYYEGLGVDQNNEEAVKWYRRGAEQGHMLGQGIMGTVYRVGIGVEPNFLEAVKWYRRAVEQGDEDSESELDQCYDDFIESDEEIVEWYRKATEQNDAEAQCYLGACYENGRGVEVDIEEAKEWYEKATEQGNAEAQAGFFRCTNSILMSQTKDFADMLGSF